MLSIVLLFVSFVLIHSSSNEARKIFPFVVSVFGFTFGLSVSRMFYLVWRDLDIVRLQANVILSAASVQERKLEADSANLKITTMNDARIRQNPAEKSAQ